MLLWWRVLPNTGHAEDRREGQRASLGGEEEVLGHVLSHPLVT